MARLGDQIDYYCGKCKMERYHTVAALGPNGTIARVVCGYCQSPRNYKAAASTTPRKASTRTTSARAQVETLPVGPPKRYAPSERFDKGDTIEHVKYGRGRVVDVRGDRIDVKFPDGSTRVFVHAG